MNHYNPMHHQSSVTDQGSFFNNNQGGGIQENEIWNSPHEVDSISQEIPMHTVLHSERGIAGFVSKLYQCLQSNDSNPKYARWCKHNGKDMFIIDCIPEFTEAVLPRLFKHCKFPSFVRQLNIYGFQRDTDARKTKDTKNKVSCRWYHPYFKPNSRDLFHLIRRKATSKKKPKKSPTEEDPETILSGDEDEVELKVLDVDEQEDAEEQDYQDEQANDILFNQEQDEQSNDILFNQEQDLFSQHVQQDHTIVVKQEEQNECSSMLYQQTNEQEHILFQQQQQPKEQDCQNRMHQQPEAHDLMFQQSKKHDMLFSQSKEHLLEQDQSMIFPQETDLTLSCINEHLTPSQLQPTITTTNNSYSIKQEEPFMRIQQLELQLYQLKVKYNKMEGYLTNELNRTKMQIKQSHHHIHQLECALGITKSVKQQTPGYMNNTAQYDDTFTYNNIMYNNYMYKNEENSSNAAGSNYMDAINFNTFL